MVNTPTFPFAAKTITLSLVEVLKGAKPGDLAVEVVTGHGLIINLKTAHEIGVTIPPEVLKRADKVIQ